MSTARMHGLAAMCAFVLLDGSSRDLLGTAFRINFRKNWEVAYGKKSSSHGQTADPRR